ncbi:MAG: hypothetical protein ABR582_04780 [Gemmatimonadaceae bacterium]
MNALLLFVLLQAAAPKPQFTVQLGSRISPDTVTVGQHFILLLKARAPRGATIQFPAAVDSTTPKGPTAPQMLGRPLFDSVPDLSGTTRTAAYRFTAWDIGQQRLGLGNITITLNGKTEYVSLGDQSVFVRSVLPADTTQRQPKPPRPAIVLVPFNWWPLIALLAAILAALLAWWFWRWYRRRKARPLPPFQTAEKEFARIEAMGLIASGEPERYAALMTDVMRDYLAARVENVQRSQTTSELIAAATPVRPYAAGLEHLLSRADLAKFARERISPDEARALGGQARTIVRQVEDHFIALEKQKAETTEAEKRAA